ncbi:MAG: carbamoyl-phosphate synthase large subunit [Myxococcota bacterium]
MPARTDIRSILVIGPGPIVIGQACEFDYSGTQAIKALKQEGYRVILVNSNPATIMTDPELADATYIEPLTVEMLTQIIALERPDALLPTVGGQTALNLACALYDQGVLSQYGVQLIGARRESVEIAEDRLRFKQAMEAAGLPTPPAGYVKSVEEAEALISALGYPAIVRPSFTLGGAGGGIAYNVEELREVVARGVSISPVGQVLVERSVLGWKEYELEVMRDHKDQVVIICSIENLDAMGVHTGDSITIAPVQTLTDREYQRMRDAAVRVIQAVGVETGGSNIQFAVNPENGDLVVVEMNPRVSRSSALASKATGFPIAKMAALLAVGYALDELPNDITRETPASFEPSIDYVVVKVPRWDFEKFPRTSTVLGTAMKSVGEVMAMGRTFREAFQKAMRSLEIGCPGFAPPPSLKIDLSRLRSKLITPQHDRIFYVREALVQGMSPEEISALSGMDPWFLTQLQALVQHELQLKRVGFEQLTREQLREAKRAGFSDKQLALLWGKSEAEVRRLRTQQGLRPVYKRVDTCAAEFEANTPYLYSTWEEHCEAMPTTARKVMILGGGPNRIGQGIEFDYCCCHAAFALQELGLESIMVNCNPETVSTDYDTSDRLYFEPLTLEDVLHLVELEKPEGLIVQFGGQTPLKLALPLHRLGVPILGTSPDSIDLAEDRERFGKLLHDLNIPQPPHGVAYSEAGAVKVAHQLGFPVLLRPSYVLGGRAMVIVYDEEGVRSYMRSAVEVSEDRPVLIDRYLEHAGEVDVDAVADGQRCVIAGILQHIEEAGIHSGDSAAVLPPYNLTEGQLSRIREYTHRLAAALQVRGLMNVQFATHGEDVYVLEVNPRASRTVPFVAKATGIPWVKVAVKVMAGVSLEAQGITAEVQPPAVFIKEAVLPFDRFPAEDTVLGPEMKSTGEVMGVGATFGEAYAKASLGAGDRLPLQGAIFFSINQQDKPEAIPIARELAQLGFSLVATEGTARALREAGLKVRTLFKVNEGRPNAVDAMKNGEVQLIINTPLGPLSRFDELALRQAAVRYDLPCQTNLAGARAVVEGLRALQQKRLSVKSLQAYHAGAGSSVEQG